MAMTIEELDKQYEGKELDRNYLHLQSVLGTQKDKESAIDKDGNHKCINWFNCQYCPASTSECF